MTPRAAAKLSDNWDSYGAAATTEKAIKAAENWTWVPLPNGGLQGEIHAGGAEVEIEIDETGTVKSVLFERVA